MEGPAPPVRAEELLAHRAWVTRVARALVRDENAADDLEQEVWVEALERPPRSDRSLGGWFTAALRHNLVDRIRSEDGRRRREEGRARPEAVPSAAELVARADAHRRVVVAVMELAEPYRSTVLYRFFEDLGPGETAARMGVPVETVRTRTRRALDLLRARMDEGPGVGRRAWALALLGPGADPAPALASIPAAATPAATALALGGLVMSKKAVAAAIAVLFLLGWVGTGLLREGDGEATPGPRESASGSLGAPASPRTTAAAGAATADPPSPAPAPPPPPSGPVRSIAVQVADETGTPVPGASVRLLDAAGRPSGEEALGDERGALTLSVPADVPSRLVARAAGFADTESRAAPEHDRVLILMKGTQVLAGRVLDGRTGKPIEGAVVAIQKGEEWKDGRRTWEAYSDGKGEFRREGLPAGRFLVGAGRCVAALGPDWDFDDVRLGPVAAGTLDLRIELTAGPVLAGVVLDDTGAPFTGAFNVSAWTIEPGRIETRYLMMYGPREDAEAGKFRLRHVEPGLYEIVVSPTGGNDRPLVFAAATLRRIPAGTEGLSPRLVRGLTIEGVAVDGDGKPVNGVFARVLGPDGDVPPADWAMGDGPDGRWTTNVLDPRHDYDLLLSTSVMDRGGQKWALLRGVRPGTRDLKVVLKAGARIEGVVRKATGEPAGADVPVTAQCLDYRFTWNGITVTSYTRADGTFSIPGLGPPGDLRFRLCAGGGASGFAPVLVDGPFVGGQRDIEVRLPATGRSVAGILRLPSGQPAKATRLHAVGVPPAGGGLGIPWYAVTTTDDEGKFRFDGLPHEAVTIWMHSGDRLVRCGTVETPASNVEMTAPLR